MCSLIAATLAATAASGAMSAYGQIQAGNAAKSQAGYQAAIQRNNAIRADYAAQDALTRGKEAEKRQRIKGRLLIGQMRAVLGGSGQVIDTGSAGELVIDQSGTNELDALNVRANAAREAYGYRTQAGNFRSQAGLTQLAGNNAASNSKFQAAGTLLSTGGKVAGQWYSFKNPTPPGGLS